MLLPSALGFSPHPPVSVYGTGTYGAIAAFLDSSMSGFATLISLPITSSDCAADLPSALLPRLARFLLSRVRLLSLCPHSSDRTQCRNINLLSIGYVSRPHLRPRLTQSRSALLWNPWIFGLDDSHIHLATHSGILSSLYSTAPYRYSFFALRIAPLPMYNYIPELRYRVLAPDIFGAGPLD